MRPSRVLGGALPEGSAHELATMARLPAQAVAERIRRLAVEFSAALQRDDMAILAIRVLRGASATADGGAPGRRAGPGTGG